MILGWIRRIRCAWRARHVLADTALLTEAYCGLANRLDDGFDEDTFADAHHVRHVIDTRLGELEAYLTAGALPDTWRKGRRGLVEDALCAADELVDKARTQHNEMLLLEYEANGVPERYLEHIRQAMASTDRVLGDIEVMALGRRGGLTMHSDGTCDLCGEPHDDTHPWQHWVDKRGRHHHRCPEHWQVRCMACGRMIRCVTHNVLAIDGWSVMDGRDALCPRCQCEGGQP